MVNNLKSALMYSVLGAYTLQIINFAVIIILSRLLTPTEIGVYAVAGSAIMVAAQIRSLGVVDFLIRENSIDEEKIRTVLGTAIFVSWGLGLLIIIAASANFYNQQDLADILWLLSITYFLGPFTSVPIALWRRNMQFKPYFIQRVVGAMVAMVSMISLALLGYSYFGLAIGGVIGVAAELAVAILLRPPGTAWIPKFKWEINVLKFGFLTSSLTYLPVFQKRFPTW